MGARTRFLVYNPGILCAMIIHGTRAHHPPHWSVHQGKCVHHPPYWVHQGICAHTQAPDTKGNCVQTPTCFSLDTPGECVQKWPHTHIP